jgi:hypothetical protein
MFCTQCGASNPDNASFCSTCGKPVAMQPTQSNAPQLLATPSPQPAPPKRRSRAARSIKWIAGAIAAVIVAAYLLSGPSPGDSLEKAGAAFAHQDEQAFDNYVDVQSILGDWTDQAASSWLADNNSNVGSTLITNGLIVGFKSLVVPKLSSSIEQEIFSNRLPNEPRSDSSSDATNYMTAFLSNSIRSLIASKISYQGIATQTTSGPNAVLDVRVGSPLSSKPLLVRVNMRRVGDHWRIVAIPNIAGLVGQLHTVGNNPALPSSPAIAPAPPSPAAPTPAAPTPAAPTPAAPTSAAPTPALLTDPTIALPPAPFDDDPIGPGGFITPPDK